MNEDGLGAPPWWESTAPGAPVVLAALLAELPQSYSGGDDAEAQDLRRRIGRLQAAIEALGRPAGAAPPDWRDQAALLVFRDTVDQRAPQVAFRVASEVRERALVDRLEVRLALHLVCVPWRPRLLTLSDEPWQILGALAKDCPAGAIVATRDAAYAIDAERQPSTFALLGRPIHSDRPMYVHPLGTSAAGFTSAPDLELWERIRRYALHDPEVRRLSYVGFRLQKEFQPTLDLLSVFVPLKVRVHGRAERLPQTPQAPIEDPAEEPREPQPDLQDDEEPWSHPGERGAARAIEPFVHVFGRQGKLVVLGEPGAGKTTLLRWLAVISAQGPYALFRELEVWEDLLPILVSVGRLAEIRAMAERENRALSVPQAIARYFVDRSIGADEAAMHDFLRRRLEGRDCFVLLDGLDEVVAERRSSVVQWLSAFAAAESGNRFVASSRPAGYVPFAAGQSAEVALLPLDDDQVKAYLTEFHRAFVLRMTSKANDMDADRRTRALIERLDGLPRLRGLARNPFLLSALALIHWAEGEVPRHRVLVYQMFARALCEQWSRARRIVHGESGPRVDYESEALPVLGRLALKMHEEWPRGGAPKSFIVETLAEVLSEREGLAKTEAAKAAEKFLETVGKELQVLYERTAGEWSFLHLSFQEFFAAAGLHVEERFEEELRRRAHAPRWREILRLGVGYQALIQTRAKRSSELIADVMDGNVEHGAWPWIRDILRKHVPLAALLAAEAGDALPRKQRQQIAKTVVGWMRSMPVSVAQPFIDEIARTEFRDEVALVLIEGLGSKDTQDVLFMLRDLGAPAAGPELTRYLARSNGPFAALAASALGAIGYRQAADVLRAKLGVQNDIVRVSFFAAHALHSMKLPVDLAVPIARHTLEYSVRFYLSSHEPSPYRAEQRDVRSLLQILLVISGLGCSARVLIRFALQDPESEVRKYAVKAAMGADPLHFLTQLASLLGTDPSQDVRARIAEVLGVKLPREGGDDSPPGLGAMLRVATVGPLIAALDDSADVRRSAARSLGHIGDTRAIVPLMATLNDRHLDVREAARDALAMFPADVVLPDLAWAIHSATSGWGVAMAVETLGRLEDPRALPIFGRLLSAPHSGVRTSAIRALGLLRAKSAVPQLQGLLQDPDARVRHATACSLARVGDSSAVAPLEETLAGTGLESGKVEAISALGELGTDRALNILTQQASAREPERLRTAAIEALWLIAERVDPRPA